MRHGIIGATVSFLMMWLAFSWLIVLRSVNREGLMLFREPVREGSLMEFYLAVSFAVLGTAAFTYFALYLRDLVMAKRR